MFPYKKKKDDEKKNASLTKMFSEDNLEDCEVVKDCSHVDERINCMAIRGSCSKDEEKKRVQLFYIKVQAKKTKVDALFDPGSQVNMISKYLVKKLGLEIQPHPKPYPLRWVCKKVHMQVIHQCKLKFAINIDYIDDVVLDVVTLDVVGIVLGSPYLFDRDFFYHRRENKYHLVKDGKHFILKPHESKGKTPFMTMGDKSMTNDSKTLALLAITHQERDKCNQIVAAKSALKKSRHHKKKRATMGVQGPMGSHSSFAPIGGSQFSFIAFGGVVS